MISSGDNALIFPYDQLSNLANYLAIFIFIQIFYRKKYISKKKNIYLSLVCLSPFFVNDFLFPWEYMYDQIRYVKATSHLRSFDFSSAEFEFGRIGSSVRFASYIYFFVPIPFIIHISSLAFANKLIYVFLYVYLNHKKYLDKYVNVFYLFFPSLIFYTSLSVRDTLIFIFSCLCVVTYLNKKYFSTFVILLVVLVNREVMGVLTFITISMHFIFFENKNYKFLIIFLYIFLGLMIFFILGDKIFHFMDYYRHGLYFDGGIDPEFVPKINDKYHFILEVLKNSLHSFFIPSFDQLSNSQRIIQFIENVVLLIFVILFAFYCIKKNTLKAIFWIIFFIISLSFFSVMVENPGTFVRYKFPIVMFFLTALSCDCIVRKNEKI